MEMTKGANVIVVIIVAFVLFVVIGSIVTRG